MLMLTAALSSLLTRLVLLPECNLSSPCYRVRKQQMPSCEDASTSATAAPTATSTYTAVASTSAAAHTADSPTATATTTTIAALNTFAAICSSPALHARVADAADRISSPLQPPPVSMEAAEAHGSTSPVRGNRRIRAGGPQPPAMMHPGTVRRSLHVSFAADPTAAAVGRKQPPAVEAALAVLLDLPNEARAEAAALLLAPRSNHAQSSNCAAAAVPAAAADQLPVLEQRSSPSAAAAVSNPPDPTPATAGVEVAAAQPFGKDADVSMKVVFGRMSLRQIWLYCLDASTVAASMCMPFAR